MPVSSNYRVQGIEFETMVRGLLIFKIHFLTWGHELFFLWSQDWHSQVKKGDLGS